ncbi:DUF4345 family protein [Ahrensia sp. R2A130]|uniref:DUF4345 family protein n=1 Tax=Ahrensia sp. R2A130 TaxID=744979 RepID=UPI0001E09C30|nr:DUF4345 family protein [Ahrensia sp. R2A130]EFL89602.1 conserved hypothetical protein [Ahrensia sp. R2A130]
MDLNTALPASLAEWAVMGVALIALAGGLVTLLDPRRIMAWTGLSLTPGRAFGLSELRGPLGGFYVGVALYIILSTPRPYIILTLAFGFACLGRVLAFVLDGVRSRENVLAATGDAILATLPALYVSGNLGWVDRLLFG